MRKLIKKSVAAALSTALLVTLGPVADISIVKAADDYTYLYAGLTWDQYWAAENIYLQSDKAMTDSNTEADARLLMQFRELLQIMDFIEEVISVMQ